MVYAMNTQDTVSPLDAVIEDGYEHFGFDKRFWKRLLLRAWMGELAAERLRECYRKFNKNLDSIGGIISWNVITICVEIMIGDCEGLLANTYDE